MRVEFETLGIPYSRPENDSSSRSYIDLKEEPDRSGELPEVQGWPELKTAIDKINAHKMFRTLGCASWVDDTNSPDSIRAVSYIGFCFLEIERNRDALSYYGLFHHFAVFLSQRTLPKDLAMHFVVKMTGFNGGKLLVGWSSELHVQGFGPSVEEARTNANLAFSLLTEFFEFFEKLQEPSLMI